MLCIHDNEIYIVSDNVLPRSVHVAPIYLVKQLLGNINVAIFIPLVLKNLKDGICDVLEDGMVLGADCELERHNHGVYRTNQRRRINHRLHTGCWLLVYVCITCLYIPTWIQFLGHEDKIFDKFEQTLIHIAKNFDLMAQKYGL